MRSCNSLAATVGNKKLEDLYFVKGLLVCILKGCGSGDQELLFQCVFSVICKEAWFVSVSPDSLCSL